MMDDGLSPRRVDLSSPRGMRYSIVTSLELVQVRIYESGSITAGRAVKKGTVGPQWPTDGRMFPVDIFEFDIGDFGWASWRIQAHWHSTGFVTAAAVEWIDVSALPHR